jgi:hypothetical protein
VTALVFVFGGVTPDDVLRGYAVLLATVIGLGSIGIFFSAITRRTGASTGLTFVVVIALVLGSQYLFEFMGKTADTGANGLRKQPPELILYLNPFVAQADVACGTEDGSFGPSCSTLSAILGSGERLNPFGGQTAPSIGDFDTGGRGGPFPVLGGLGVNDSDQGGASGDAWADADQSNAFRDRFWPKTVISFLVLAAVLTTLSIQFVTPTRRWRPSLPGPVRRLTRRRSHP